MASLPDHPSIAAVIPCFNEERHIGSVVASVRAVIPMVLVVDDGSTDRTLEVAGAAGATPLHLPANLGKGEALRSGLLRAVELRFDFAILMDGDGQHDPADLPKFVEAAEVGDADLVVGNRMNEMQAMPPVRRFVNRWMSRRISKLAGLELPDSQCGYRLLRLSAWERLEFRASRFEIESEMLIAFVTAGLRVRFVPVRTIYRDSQSKIHPVRDTIRWFRWWRRTRRRLAGR